MSQDPKGALALSSRTVDLISKKTLDAGTRRRVGASRRAAVQGPGPRGPRPSPALPVEPRNVE